ncbi:MAG: sulfotransferase [Geminicoccaceae bacterium]
MARRFPDTFLCAAPKCATTSLARALGEHPQIFLPDVKEPNYFNKGYSLARVPDLDAYLALYELALPSQRLLDASILYLHWRTAVPAILRDVPDARFICVFRPPLDVFLAWHNQLLRIGVEHEYDPERAWDLCAERQRGRFIRCRKESAWLTAYDQLCLFGDQMQRLLAIVPASHVLVLAYDDVIKTWQTTRERLLAFLELPDAPLSLPRLNSGRTPKSILIDRLRQPIFFYTGRVKKWLRIQRDFGLQTKFYHLITSPRRAYVPSDAFMRRFEAHVADDLDRLAALTGLRLPVTSMDRDRQPD